MAGETIDYQDIGVPYPALVVPPPPAPGGGSAGGDCPLIAVQCCALRVAFLNPDGSFSTLPNAMHVSDHVVRLGVRPIWEEQAAFMVNCPSGVIPLVHRPPRILSGVDVRLEVLSIDEELMGILSPLVAVNGDPPTAWVVPAIGVPDFHSVSIEAWAKTFVGNQQSGYVRFVLPRVYLYPDERVLENQHSPTLFEGFGIENALWGTGPAGDWTPTAPINIAGRAFGAIRDTALPEVGCGTVPIPNASAT